MAVLIALVFCCLAKTVYAESPCTTPNGELARCIPIKQCKIFLDVLKNRIRPPPSVINFMRESSCGFDNGPLVCCGNFNHHIRVEPTPPTADPRKHKNFHLLPTNCGLQEVDEKVLGEETEAQLEEFPWMALLEYNRTDKPRNYNFLAGGTLINNQYVLTVSHGIIREIPFSVRLGDHDLHSEIDCRKNEGNQNYELCINNYEDIPIERVIRHVDFDDIKQKNDIALIRLARPATISTNIRPICLPLNGEETQPGRRLFVAGWGSTKEIFRDGDNKITNIKRKAQLPIVALDKCSEMYKKNFINITEKHLCAGGEVGVDACKGDSGNALVTLKVGSVPPQWYMEGILSFGFGCGHNIPAIYTRVSKYLNWILDHMED